MSKRITGAVGALVLVVTLALGSTAAGANAPSRHDWRAPRSNTTELSVVHGIPNLPVDVYVVKNFFSVRKLADVNFGTAADLDKALPGFVTPGFYFIDVVPAGTSPFHPLLKSFFFLGADQSKTVVAYVTADAAGHPGGPTLGVFTNDVSSTMGGARATVRHTAVAPTVGVYANGAVGIPPSFSNGQSFSGVVPASTYDVTVTAPNTPSTILADLGPVTLPANTNTLAFAIGTYPATFKVVTLQIPTAH
jgi:hypothetical protein